jgi:hypothetical protein
VAARRARAIWAVLLAASTLFLLSGLIRWPEIVTEPLGRGFDLPGWTFSAFSARGVYPQLPPIPGGIHAVGSWIESDRSTGEVVSPWIEVDPDVELWIAGSPAAPGNHLQVTFRTEDGRTFPVLATRNPGLHWERWKPAPVPAGRRLEMQIAARDGSEDPGGWLAFSEPVRVRSSAVPWSFIRLVLAMAAVACFVVGPGMARVRGAAGPGAVALLPLPGLAWLVALAIAAWTMRPAWSRPFLDLSLLALLAWTARRTLRLGVWECLSPSALRALTLAVGILVLGGAKAALSAGPPGELYGGAVSRSLEFGDRSDSRIQYHLAQLVLLHSAPTSALSRELFLPYSFSARGPLAGLIAAPLVSVSGAELTRLSPNEPWALFDEQGFVVYRLACMALAAIALLAAFGWVEALAGSSRAILAATLLAGCPFFIHEVYFTWPKLLTAYFVLLSLLGVTRGRSFLAGCALGLGYLAHPGVLLAVPMTLGMLVVRQLGRGGAGGWRIVRDRALLLDTARVLSGLALGVLCWWVVNRGHLDQGSFVAYLVMAYGRRAASLQEWLGFRVESLVNTLVPLAGLRGPSPPGVPAGGFPRLAFQVWLNLGFALGLSAVPAFLLALGHAARHLASLFLLVLAVPFVLFALYWGATDAGLMREGLQAWFCALVCVAAIAWRSRGWLPRLLGGLLLFRGLEVAVMLLWPIVLPRPGTLEPYRLSDAALALMLCALVVWLTFRTARALGKVADAPEARFPSAAGWLRPAEASSSAGLDPERRSA